jgi:hypothetical protein
MWDDFQNKFGRQWYLHKSEFEDKLVTELRVIYANIRLVLMAAMACPSAYDVPGRAGL